MDVNSRRQVYSDALDMWGVDLQLDVAIEEMSELTKAIIKRRRFPHQAGTLAKIIEEIGDVEIMMEQMRFILGPAAEDAVELSKRLKINRLKVDIAKTKERSQP